MQDFRSNDGSLPLTRRNFIRQTGGALLAGPWLLNHLKAQAAESASPPNILLIMVDQLRFPLGDSAKMPLPGVERLRREGLTFEAAYCSATPCTPSRATIFTGLHMPQHGLEINVCEAVPQLNPNIPTLGHYFEHAGYRTPYFGKWHLSTDEKYGNGVGLKPYGFEEWPGTEITGDCEGSPGDGITNDGKIANMTIDWLKAHADGTQPWLLTCSLVNPHDIMFYKGMAAPSPVDEPDAVPHIADTLPANFSDDLSKKPKAHAQYQKLWGTIWKMPANGASPATTEDWLRALDYYYFYTKSADDQIVRVLNALDELKLTDNTLVVFLSDHGELCASHQMMGKGPFMYEESVRVPLVVRWPGHVAAGATTKSLVQTVDLLPTFLDVAGIAPTYNYMPGKSLKPILLENSATAINDHVLMTYGMSIVQVIAENAEYGATMPDGLSPAPWKFRAIHTGSYKYARYYEDSTTEEEYELYNLVEDPTEVDNLANKIVARDKKKEMADQLAAAEQKEMAAVNPDYFNAPFGPALKVATATGGQVKVSFDTQLGVQYQLQTTANFTSWTDSGSVLTGTGGVMEIMVDSGTSPGFFRVKRL